MSTLEGHAGVVGQAAAFDDFAAQAWTADDGREPAGVPVWQLAVAGRSALDLEA